MITVSTACLFLQSLCARWIASARARAKTVFGHLKWNYLWCHHFPHLHNTKTWTSLKLRKIFQKGKSHCSLLWKAFKISSNYAKTEKESTITIGTPLILGITVMIYWQLSRQGICWPVSHDHIAGLGQDIIDFSCLGMLIRYGFLKCNYKK